MATPGVGQDIEDECAKCGDMWHAVVAKLGDRVVKVVCKRCGGQHNYRGAANAAGAKAASTKTGTVKRAVSRKRSAPTPPPLPSFDPAKPPRTYAPRDSYERGERIAHSSFGVGIVAGKPGPGEVDVIFPNGPRLLVCSRQESSLQRPEPAANVPISDRPPDE